jgi:carboxyl-terminal processing protease
LSFLEKLMKTKFKLTLRQIRIAILALAFLIIAGEIGYWLGASGFSFHLGGSKGIEINRALPEDKSHLDFSLFWEVWDKVSATYLDKSAVKPREMIYGAIKGMVASLGDPYTAFLPPEENKEVKEDLNGKFEGIGIQLGYRDGTLAVVAPLAGSPAEKAGIRAGDLIIKIDDKETIGVSLPEAVKLIRGEKGTKVKLTLIHEAEMETFDREIVRETIIVPSVELSYVENDIAHLKLTRFSDTTNEEWLKAVDEIVSHQPLVKGVILDLRNNPGGYLTGSVFIASEFLPSGVVVQQQNADGTKETFSVDRLGKITTQSLVVLVNEGSASASEIVAGALKDYGRAKIIGEKSFGKGTIQEAYDIGEGSGLHITTARWLLPNGDWIDKKGITPDYEIADDTKTEEDEQLDKAVEVLLESPSVKG